jgi:hypothetical protein
VVDLIGSLQEFSKLQDERAERVAESLERIAENLTGVREASGNQTELLTEIRAQLQAGTAGGKRLEDALSELPRIADAQRETMVSIGRQLDVLRESGEQETKTTDELRQSVSRLVETTLASTAAFKEMHVDSAAREEQMAKLVQEQTRRLTFFALAAVALAVVAALASVAALLR